MKTVENCAVQLTVQWQSIIQLAFSNSLIIHQVQTKKFMTVTMFENLILISIDFYDFIFLFCLSFSFSWEDISNTLNTFPKIQKFSTLRRFFNSFFGVWKCGQPRSFVFDILRLWQRQNCRFRPRAAGVHSLSKRNRKRLCHNSWNLSCLEVSIE